MKERIQKILANAGVDSRRKIEEMVRQGRVVVNGKVRTELPILIDPEKDKIVVDDEPIKIKTGRAATAAKFYILMNKPKGVYCTNVAQGAQVRAIDLLPKTFKERVYPVGRLDAESRGLLLLTNDGELTNELTHPRYGVSKTYRAVVDGSMDPRELERLQEGIWLADPRGKGFKTGKSRIKVVKRAQEKSILEITIREGRNRQVRRMLASVGHKVRDLVRIKMGPLTLEGINPGHFRPLSPKEVKALRKLAHSDESASVERDENGD